VKDCQALSEALGMKTLDVSAASMSYLKALVISTPETSGRLDSRAGLELIGCYRAIDKP
jgi:hypothetical protein